MKRMIVPLIAVAWFASAFAAEQLKVGMYGDTGPGGMGSVELMRWINRSPEMSLVVLTGEDVRGDALQDVDLFVLASADGSTYDSLGEIGRTKLVAYLRDGGKCLVTGTGAALLALPTNATDKCLGVIPFKSRGHLGHRLSLAPNVNATGAAALGVPSGYSQTLRYSGGPYLVSVANGVEGATFATWATYRSEINLTGRVSNLMFDSTAIAGGTLGNGKIVVFTHEPQYESGKRPFIAGAIKWLTGRTITIPQHVHGLHAVSVGLATDRVTLASVAPFVCALDADSRFDLSSVDAIGAAFDSLEHLDAMVFPDGSDDAALLTGGSCRVLVEETAAAGVKPFVWGTGANVLPLAGAVTCTDSADALVQLRAAFPEEGEPGAWTRPTKVPSPLRVTVFGDRGPCGACAHEWYRVINDSPEMSVTVATGYQIRNSDILDRTDLFVVPGGNSSDIPSALMTTGINKLLKWLKDGGRYFGTCCGCAILLQQQYYFSIAPFVRLGSVPTDWGGNYGVDFSAEAAAALGMTPGCHQYRYAEGPIMAPGNPVADSTIVSWGTYCGEGQYNTICNGVAAQQYGATAMIAGGYGAGKVFAIALHPEAYRSTHELIVKGFKWLTGRDVTIPKRVRKPGAIRVAIQAGNGDSTLSLLSPLSLAIDGDAAFDLFLGNNTDFSNFEFEHVDAIVLPSAPVLSSLANPSTVAGSGMKEFIAGGGKCFGWGENAEVVRSFGSQGVVCESAEDVYRALRETYQVTSDPSIHLHSWTDETNSVLSCTTDGVVVRTCHTDGCPIGVQTNTTPALGHDFGDWVIVTPSTETTRGVKRHTCRRAGCGFSEDKAMPKINETYYKVGVDPYGSSSFAKSYSSSIGWAEAVGGTVDADHAVDPEVNYVVPEGTRLRTLPSGSVNTFAGKSLTLAGAIALNDAQGYSSKTVNLPPVTVSSTTAVFTIGNPNAAYTLTGLVAVPESKLLRLNLYAESNSGPRYGLTLSGRLSGAGDISIDGSATYAPPWSFVILSDAAAFSGTLKANTARDMHFNLKVTGGFGGSITALPVGTTNVVFNYDGLSAERGLPIAVTTVPPALTNRLTFYSATADFTRDRLSLMTFPAGTVLDVSTFTVKHATSLGGAATPFVRLAAVTAADGSVRLVANCCDHRWGAWVVRREPTFLDAGETCRVCEICGAVSAPEPVGKLAVPDGYKAVAYVEAAADQYIDTGVCIQDRIKSDLTFSFTSLSGAATHMLGAWDKSDGNMREYLVNIGATAKWRGALADTAPVEFSTLPVAKAGATNHVVTTVEGKSYTMSVNGTAASMTFASGVATRPQTHYLFTYNEEGRHYSESSARLFEAKIYTNLAVLARQYLPLYKTDTKKYGLWDTVTGTFKVSQSNKGFTGAEPAPDIPTINGEPVEPSKVFEKATSRKPIVYPSSVVLAGEPGSQTIAFAGTVTDVPSHYTASVDASGTVVKLVLNDNAQAVFTDDEKADPPKKAFTLEDGKIRIHVGNAQPLLYYALGFVGELSGEWSTNEWSRGATDFEDEPGAGVPQRFYRVFTTDAP